MQIVDFFPVLDGNGILPTGLSGESMPLGGESSDTQEGTLESGGERLFYRLVFYHFFFHPV